MNLVLMMPSSFGDHPDDIKALRKSEDSFETGTEDHAVTHEKASSVVDCQKHKKGIIRLFISSLPLINGKMTTLSDLQSHGFAQKELQNEEENEMDVIASEADDDSGSAAAEIPAAIANSDLAPQPSFDFTEISSMSDNEINDFRDARGFNILMLASEAGRLDVLQNLIDAGDDISFEVEGESAASLAYKGGHHDVVLVLLKANAKIPSNLNRETVSDELKAFLDLSIEMHKKVREASEENLGETKNFLKQNVEANAGLRYFYDTNNCSLLKSAILNRKFSLYELLLSLNIFLASDESMDDINESLTDEEREELSDINYKFSPNLVTEPMMILMRNCKLGPDSPKDRDAEFMFYIRKAFDELFMIRAIAIVLKIVAASRKFKIIFDFKRDSVTFLDPKSEPYCTGLMYLNGKIYVGAKDMFTSRWVSTVGTIAHELTHYAMCLIYDNWAKPYKEKDKETEARFDLISQACKRVKDSEDLVGLVYECYDEDMQHAELIVRVPHILATYFASTETLIRLGAIFHSLFAFYEQTCMPQMEAELPKIEKKFSPARKAEEKVRRHKIFNFALVFSIIIGTILSVFLIYWALPVSWSDLDSKDQNIVKNGTVRFNGVNVKFGELFQNDSKVFDLLSSEQIKKALKGETEELSKALNETLHPYVFLTWSNMTKELKEKFLTCEVDFQGQKVAIEKITKEHDTLKLLHSENVRKILTTNSFKISSPVERKTKVYVERFFADQTCDILSEEQIKSEPTTDRQMFYKNGKINVENSNVTSFEKIEQGFNDSKVFVLSSGAGDGKSTAFRHFSLKLKKIYPHKWIQFVDLKKHFEVFDKAQNLHFENFKVLSNFLGENLVNLEGFELEIFKEHFATNNVIFLWDGVDEISPRFKDFMLNLTENISRTNNFQLISSRPHHSSAFEETLKVKAQKLIPFSELDRFEVLVKTIASLKFNEDGKQIFNELKNLYNQSVNFFYSLSLESNASKYFRPITKGKLVFELMKKITENVDSFVSNPLLVSMISEISFDENLDISLNNSALNVFELYEVFIIKKLKIIRTKGEVVESDRDEVIATSSINIWQVHQVFALRLMVNALDLSKEDGMKEALSYIKDKIDESLKTFTTEQISRFGILQVQSETDFDFAHISFAEFFVAQFFLDNIFLKGIRSNIVKKEHEWKVSLLFEFDRERSFYFYIFGATIRERYNFLIDPLFSSQLIETAYSKNSTTFENIFKFTSNFQWPFEIVPKLFSSFYEGMKLKNDLESVKLMMIDYSLKRYMELPDYAETSKTLKNKFEALRHELREKSKEGLVQAGIKIRRGDYEELFEWSEIRSRYGISFDTALPDLIKSAYSNNSEEFQNILSFIYKFPDFSQNAIGLSALYKEMKSNNDYDSFKVTTIYYFVKELLRYSTVKQGDREIFEFLKHELEEKSKKGIEESGAMIKSGDYEKVLKWADDSSSISGIFNTALLDLINVAYSSESNEFQNILRFIANLEYAPQIAVSFSVLYDEIILKNDLDGLQILMFTNLVNHVMSLSGFIIPDQNLKAKLKNIKVDLVEKSKGSAEECGNKIRNGDFEEIIPWAQKFNEDQGLFMDALSPFIKSAYSNKTSEFQNVLKFIRSLSTFHQATIGFLIFYQEMRSEEKSENLHYVMLDYLISEFSPLIPNHFYFHKYKIMVLSVKAELSEKSKIGIEELGVKVKNGDYQEIIEWAENFNQHRGSFELALPDLIKSAYSSDLNEFQNILMFIGDLPFSKSTVGLSVFYDEMKSKNDLESFKLTMTYYLARALMNHKAYAESHQDYLDNLEVVMTELNKYSREIKDEMEILGVMIRKGDNEKILKWLKSWIGKTYELALPDLIRSAYSNDINNFDRVWNFIRNLELKGIFAIGLTSFYEEMKSNNDLDSFQLMMLTYEIKRFIDVPDFPEGAYKDKFENLKKELPSNVRNFIWSSKENCTIESKFNLKLYVSDESFGNGSAQVFTSIQENPFNSSKWSIQTNNLAKSFSFENLANNKFLVATDESFGNNQSRVFVRKLEEKGEEFYWQIIPQNNSFLIFSAKFNESLFATDVQFFDEKQEEVFTSKLEDISDQNKWEIRCV